MTSPNKRSIVITVNDFAVMVKQKQNGVIMKKISEKILSKMLNKTKEEKKHFMIYVPLSDWDEFKREVDKTGIPASRYIHAMILERLEDKEE